MNLVVTTLYKNELFANPWRGRTFAIIAYISFSSNFSPLKVNNDIGDINFRVVGFHNCVLLRNGTTLGNINLI